MGGGTAPGWNCAVGPLRRLSPRARILLLVGGTGLILAVAAAAAAWTSHAAARERLQAERLGVARLLALAVDHEFGRVEALLLGLATSPALDAVDAAAFLAQARPLLGRLGGGSLLLAGPEAPAPPPGLEAVIATGRTTITDLLADGPAGRPSIALGVPVPPAAAGPARLVLGAALPPALLDAVLGGPALPSGWAALVLDRQAAVVAEAGPAALVRQLRLAGGSPAEARAPASGYAVAVLAAGSGDSDRAALLRASGIGLLLGLAGLGLAAFLARRATGGQAPVACRPAAPAPGNDDAWAEAGQDAGEVGSWLWDLQAGTLRWSAAQFRLHGIEAGGEGPEPDRWRAAIAPEDRPGLEAALAEAQRSGRFEVEYRVPAAAGAPRWLAARGRLERDALGQPWRLLGAGIDITCHRAREESLREQLRMKELVVAEVHHRVKNSLQLMHGVLLMQARTAGPEAATRLREAAGRVLTVAAVHRRLYEEGAQEGTDLAPYLAGLIEDLGGSLGAPLGSDAASAILLRAEPGLRLTATQLAPLGLVVTELVTNALKYGTPPVVVRCAREDRGLRLTVEDAGPGFPPGFDPMRARGLGMRLSAALVRHHRGRLEIDRAAPGGRVVLVLAGAPGSPYFQ